jgi:sigma-B regulation protein RsbU (phosphoserine phosphatase)
MKKINSQNTIVGFNNETEFKSDSISIENKSCLYLYTDGAYEIELQSGVTMQIDNLVEFLHENENEDFSEINLLYQHLQKLNKCDKLEDDFTMIKMKFE